MLKSSLLCVVFCFLNKLQSLESKERTVDWCPNQSTWKSLTHLEEEICSDNKMTSPSTTALLLGSTGETGKQLLKQLANNPNIAKIVTVGRRSVELGEGMDKVEQKLVNFDSLEEYADQFTNIDKAFCCLGTTRGKAGKEGFIKVDYTYVLKSAELLKAAGCNEFHLLTSKGSNKDSWFLYPSTKGKVEEAVKGLGFERLGIYRPGLLITPEGREEKRATEGWLQSLANWIDKSHSWSLPVSLVARSMMLTGERMGPGLSLLEHHDIVELAKEK